MPNWPPTLIDRSPPTVYALIRVVLVLLCLFAAPVQAHDMRDLAPGGSATVKEVLSGDVVVLADGRTVRLAGIQAPKLPLAHAHARKMPLADESRLALERLALGRTVTLYFGSTHQDRHDRFLAQLVRDDGVWLQQAMLSQGWARVYVLYDRKLPSADLLAAEAPAREARRGLWAHRAYAPHDPDGLGHDFDSFQVVEGRIVSATVIRGQLFIDFGPDWKTDFTIRIPRRAMRAFRQSLGDIQALAGRTVRVRGWVYRRNGPEIEATVPEQIELLDPPAPTPTAAPTP
ncbi:MAG: thermonuclease family protein [Rhodospirillaceae bacterium]